MGGIAIDKKKIIEDEEKQKKIDKWRKILEWIFDNVLFYRIDNLIIWRKLPIYIYSCKFPPVNQNVQKIFR